jgi:hypothetical protein
MSWWLIINSKLRIFFIFRQEIVFAFLLNSTNHQLFRVKRINAIHIASSCLMILHLELLVLTLNIIIRLLLLHYVFITSLNFILTILFFLILYSNMILVYSLYHCWIIEPSLVLNVSVNILFKVLLMVVIWCIMQVLLWIKHWSVQRLVIIRLLYLIITF